jgi:hypothetical protein
MAVEDVQRHAAALVTSVRAFEGDEGEPAVMMALASGRCAFFQPLFNAVDLEDSLAAYGSVGVHVQVEGGHLDVCTRCIANLVPEFTEVLEDWLRPWPLYIGAAALEERDARFW